MKMRTKRIFSAILCAVMLTVYGMPVLAAENQHYYSGYGLAAESTCTHPSYTIEREKATPRYVGVDVTGHNYGLSIPKYCNSCGSSSYDYEVWFRESHNYTRYHDLGHRGMTHDYYIYCPTCDSQYKVAIGCEGPSHSTPW